MVPVQWFWPLSFTSFANEIIPYWKKQPGKISFLLVYNEDREKKLHSVSFFYEKRKFQSYKN